jgi:hypothetical protein
MLAGLYLASFLPAVAEVWLHTTVGLALETWPGEHQPQPTEQTNENVSASLCKLGDSVEKNLITEPMVTYE